MTKYAPVFSLIVGSTNISLDTIEVDLNQTVTNKVPNFRIKVSNQADKYDLLQFLNRVTLSVDTVPILSGRVEQSNPSKTKKKNEGETLELTGYGDAKALQDALIFRDVRDKSAYDTVDELINVLYAAVKKASDPTITLDPTDNNASLNMLCSYEWMNKSIWSCVNDINIQQGSKHTPDLHSGKEQFLDFWANPARAFKIYPVGSIDSGVVLSSGDEIVETHHVRDSTPIKTNMILQCNATAGRIPLQMQAGYADATAILDPWTENNKNDFGLGPNIVSMGDSLTAKVGSYSVIAVLEIPYGGGPTSYAYWYMRFPFGHDPVTNTWKWPNQEPDGGLNTYNMTWNNESIGTPPFNTPALENNGQISTIGFWLYPTMNDLHFCLEVVDGNLDPLTIASQIFPVAVGEWTWFEHPFGPASNVLPLAQAAPAQGYSITSGTRLEFDWRNVAEIRFKVVEDGSVTPYDNTVMFDGFQFVKPLMVQYPVRSGEPTIVTQRGAFNTVDWLKDWRQARDWASGLYENLSLTQEYYTVKNLGRVDIAAGEVFTLDSKALVARNIHYVMSKDGGWLIDVEGWPKA